MTDVNVTIRMFGAFRKYGAEISFPVPAGSGVADIKAVLSGLIHPEDRLLVNDSVIANDDAVLAAEARIEEDTRLAILPPVCGG